MAGNVLALFDLDDPNTKQMLPDFDRIKCLQTRICSCCHGKENGMKAKLTTKAMHMSRLGTAAPGFFSFAKFCILTMVTTLLVYSLYNAYHYARINRCGYNKIDEKNGECCTAWKFYLSSANKTHDPNNKDDQLERVLFVLAIIFIYLFKIFFYRRLRLKAVEAENFVTDITSYSVELRGLPSNVTKKDLVDFFARQDIRDRSGEFVAVGVRMVNFTYKKLEVLDKAHLDIKRLIGQYIEQSSAFKEVFSSKESLE